MPSPLFDKLNLDTLNASRLWLKLDRETRRAAAESLYGLEGDEQSARLTADAAIATAMRFRPASIRKLAVDKKIGYLATSVRPDENLATVLLQALHFQKRRTLLGAFLDELGIEHEDGHIKDETNLAELDADRVAAAARKLYAGHDEAEVDVYLASLLAFEPEIWGALRPVLAERAA